ncbi:ribulose-phosphate 3-epimerase [Pectinatus sottacetonis]|uniref:ribulose-phosphate 3-epimerase n=1 Tax=Pectinatus sottacetonis TaxID=1002795 RepID=UPI001E519424|nr:ribulose-phosphate 3-epimerase [Pectinatus sottacetonis]
MIAPVFSASVSCMNIGGFAAAIKEVEKLVGFLHYDIVDGKFNKCYVLGDIAYQYLKKNSKLPIELHLAVENPEEYINIFAGYGVDYIAVHYEAMTDPQKTFQLIRRVGAVPVLAYRAETAPQEDFFALAQNCAWILKLTVNPGFSGQKINTQAIDHIRLMAKILRKNNSTIRIQADGNVNCITIKALYIAGATIFTCGTSGLFRQGRSLRQNLRELRNALPIKNYGKYSLV